MFNIEFIARNFHHSWIEFNEIFLAPIIPPANGQIIRNKVTNHIGHYAC